MESIQVWKSKSIKGLLMSFIRNTKSVCPQCLSTIEASLSQQGSEIIMKKSCPEHGDFQSIVWRNEPNFEEWEEKFSHKKDNRHKHLQPLNFLSNKTCPNNCGICSEHEQSSCTVLLELTSACNLSCPICFASSQNNKENTFEPLENLIEKIKWIRENAGPVVLQLSGGEPTIYPYLIELVEKASKLFPAVQLNTNGILLGKDEKLVKKLKDAGLSWVFLQFDTLDDEINLKMRGAKLVEIKKKAIANCEKAGLSVVLVCTIAKNINEFSLANLLDFAIDNFPCVRALHFQPMTLSGRNNMENQKHITLPEVIKLISKQSNGRMKTNHALASDCEHALCSFHARYFVDKNNNLHYIQSEKSLNLITDSDEKLHILENAPARNIETVVRAWQGEIEKTSLDELTIKNQLDKEDKINNPLAAFDDFIKKAKEQTFSISCMAFQDAYTIDLNRLKQCCIHIYAFHGNRHKLIPFCAYNLTSTENRSLYR